MPIHIMGYDGIDRHKICYTAKTDLLQIKNAHIGE